VNTRTLFTIIPVWIVAVSIQASPLRTPIDQPVLTVNEPNLGSWIFQTNGQEPPVIVTAASPATVLFDWSADASAYGGTIVGYRYGWDITDPDDDEQWEIPWEFGTITSAPQRTFFFGTHVLDVQTKDDAGTVTWGSVRINVQVPTPVESSTWGAIKALYEAD
jgi:hypothetical protein